MPAAFFPFPSSVDTVKHSDHSHDTQKNLILLISFFCLGSGDASLLGESLLPNFGESSLPGEPLLSFLVQGPGSGKFSLLLLFTIPSISSLDNTAYPYSSIVEAENTLLAPIAHFPLATHPLTPSRIPLL
jgi:hypothetical protein